MNSPSDPDQFATVLERFVGRSAYTPGQLAGLAALPKTTIVNWLNGRVRRPREWQGVAALAVALRLTEAEADELLAAAGQPAIRELRLLATAPSDRELLAHFAQTVTRPEPQVPFQAIPLPPYFVGREEELSRLKEALTAPGHNSLYALVGMAGAGKTSLAAQLAYQLRDQFVDGVLWARLDSSDALAILATFAAAYGRDVSHLPDVASRSRVVRELLMPKQTLIVLDNAETSEQIEPLLPPTGRCAVLITSRRQDLASLAGARRFEITPFSDDEAALALFSRILGPERAAQAAATLRQIAAQLGHLPLALVIAASRLAYEPHWQPADLARRLADASRRLPALNFETQNVASSFALSYERLEDSGRRLLAAAGTLSRQSFGLATVAALARLDEEEAEAGLRQLFSLSLLGLEGTGRYRLHPLLHDFARGLSDEAASTPGFVTYWHDFAARHRHAFTSLDAELGHLELALERALRAGLSAPAWQLLNNLIPFLIGRGRFAQAEAWLQKTRAVAVAAADLTGQSRLLLRLGQLAQQQQQLDSAWHFLSEGLALARQQGDEMQTARCLAELGIVHNCRGEYDDAREKLEAALPVLRPAESDDCLLHLLEELGILAMLAGDRATAQAYYQEGLAVAEVQGNQAEMAMMLKGLGTISYLEGNLAGAAITLQQGYEIAWTAAFQKGLMLLENNLAVLAWMEGERDVAAGRFEAASLIAEQLDDSKSQALIQSNLINLALQRGQVVDARQRLDTLLALSERQGWPDAIAAVQTTLVALTSNPEQAQSEADRLRMFI
ncbi:MAG: AAA family ATPase [Ardenticatenales bacterium]|nr:AAA family ATPase [Ardenticatenales bacterium]